MKIAPILREIESRKNAFEHFLVHTGQHYDQKMSESFFQQLDIPSPDINLEVGSASHAQQTARIMIEFEKILLERRPDFLIVVGDVNSTIACSLVAAKLGIRIAHVEAGLRSYDRSMPEEINRVLTDAISDVLFTTEESGNINLRREGVADSKIFFVGNVMIDSLIHSMEKIKSSPLPFASLSEKPYGVVTLHRPSNVDDPGFLKKILQALWEMSNRMKLVIPLHPRTQRRIESYNYGDILERIRENGFVTEPVSYHEMIRLVLSSKMVITDSGGIQEETTFLGVPCITLRENTERPVTVEKGTNVIVGRDLDLLSFYVDLILQGKFKKGSIPPLWDGKTSTRIVEALLSTHSAP